MQQSPLNSQYICAKRTFHRGSTWPTPEQPSCKLTFSSNFAHRHPKHPCGRHILYLQMRKINELLRGQYKLQDENWEEKSNSSIFSTRIGKTNVCVLTWWQWARLAFCAEEINLEAGVNCAWLQNPSSFCYWLTAPALSAIFCPRAVDTCFL